jgi:hypothetical protein
MVIINNFKLILQRFFNFSRVSYIKISTRTLTFARHLLAPTMSEASREGWPTISNSSLEIRFISILILNYSAIVI